jgi:hypothetical protein
MLAEHPFPSATNLEALVLAARTAGVTELGVLPDEMLVEPATHLGAELLVLGGEPQIHGRYGTCSAPQI